MNRFRPQNINSLARIQSRRRGGGGYAFNRQSRLSSTPPGYQLNHVAIARVFNQLHYLACHSPKSVAAKWRSAYNMFTQRHFAQNASDRFANKYSCYSWL
jgi:hypothetical protein